MSASVSSGLPARTSTRGRVRMRSGRAVGVPARYDFIWTCGRNSVASPRPGRPCARPSGRVCCCCTRERCGGSRAAGARNRQPARTPTGGSESPGAQSAHPSLDNVRHDRLASAPARDVSVQHISPTQQSDSRVHNGSRGREGHGQPLEDINVDLIPVAASDGGSGGAGEPPCGRGAPTDWLACARTWRRPRSWECGRARHACVHCHGPARGLCGPTRVLSVT